MSSASLEPQPSSLSGRPLYTPHQVREVYDRIELPVKFRYEPPDFSKVVTQMDNGMSFLNALIRYTLASVPFENLDLHYSFHRTVSLDPESLFQKIVRSGNGRGGCYAENNTWFSTLLRSVGYNVFSVGARVNERARSASTAGRDVNFGGWSHMVNLVLIHSELHLVDVGFGPGGPPIALPLNDRKDHAREAPVDLGVRLRWDAVLDGGVTRNKMWICERRLPDGFWTPLYCFSADLEFTPKDFEMMTFYNSRSPRAFLTFQLVCVKAVLDNAGDRVIGDIVLSHKAVHRRSEGGRHVLARFVSEAQRFAALEEFLQVRLTNEQKDGILGTVTALDV